MPDRTRRLHWPEQKQVAVSLSYDGGDLSHLETAVTCLDALCLRATFYAPPTRILDDPRAWRAVAAAKHEIGNASLFEAANDAGLLAGWTPQMVEEDLKASEAFYRETVPASKRRSLALPLPAAADSPAEMAQQSAAFRTATHKAYSIVRGTVDGINEPRTCDLRALRVFAVTDQTADELITMVEAAVTSHAWIVFAFRGIGVGDPAIDAVHHAKFCLWLAENHERAWVAPVIEIGMQVRRTTSVAVRSMERESEESRMKQTV